MYPAYQSLTPMFPTEEALEYGTLFQELYKPYPGSGTLNKPVPACLSNVFSLWELRLYLNTHPNDAAALNLYRRGAEQVHQPNYATTFDQDSGSGAWAWGSGLWPWQQGMVCP